MIRAFKCRDTERLFSRFRAARFATIERVARRRLDALDAATNLDDLRSPPGNQLEALKGDRRGQYSVRINDRWRICFRWDDRHKAAYDVEIVDYH